MCSGISDKIVHHMMDKTTNRQRVQARPTYFQMGPKPRQATLTRIVFVHEQVLYYSVHHCCSNWFREFASLDRIVPHLQQDVPMRKRKNRSNSNMLSVFFHVFTDFSALGFFGFRQIKLLTPRRWEHDAQLMPVSKCNLSNSSYAPCLASSRHTLGKIN